jgi:hypothetical protein
VSVIGRLGAVQRAVLDVVERPAVRWGDVTGADAGELLQIGVLDFAGAVGGWLYLPDGRRLALTLLEDRVTALVPADASPGAARVTLYDAAGNESDPLTFALDGITPGPPPVPPVAPSPPGFPAPARPRRRPPPAPAVRAVASRSRLAVRSRAIVAARTEAASRATLTSTATVGGRTRTVSRERTRSVVAVHAGAVSRSSVQARSTVVRVRRRDVEGELLALLL